MIEQTGERDVDFWFDPACPWAWLTSRWLLEAAKVRPIRPRFRVMSLAALNEGRDLNERCQAFLATEWQPVRLGIAVFEHGGADALARYYTELGTRVHNQQRPMDEATLTEALQGAGLPAELAAAANDPGYDAAVRESHTDGISRVGTDVGTPIISVNGMSIFGPVVTPVPKGEAAGRLWDGILLIAETPGFYELKRTRDARPSFD